MFLRYPGGKSKGKWSNFIADVVEDQYGGGVFGELFFGGGGITLKLLKRGVIDSLVMNERDVSLARLWNAVIKNPSRLNQGIRGVKPSVDLFLRSKARVKRGVGSGLESLIVNRLSHGGRGPRGGPQGGKDQRSKYKINCRWNVEKLCKNVTKCSRLLNSVEIIGGKCYSGDYQPHLGKVDMAYLDPPYWQIGEGLYLHPFDEKEHNRLYRAVKDRKNWVLSYNNVPEIRKLYRGFYQQVGSMAGNEGSKEGSELLISPWEL